MPRPHDSSLLQDILPAQPSRRPLSWGIESQNPIQKIKKPNEIVRKAAVSCPSTPEAVGLRIAVAAVAEWGFGSWVTHPEDLPQSSLQVGESAEGVSHGRCQQCPRCKRWRLVFSYPWERQSSSLNKNPRQNKVFFFPPGANYSFLAVKKKKISIVGLYHVSKGGEGFCPQSSCPNICLLHSGE